MCVDVASFPRAADESASALLWSRGQDRSVRVWTVGVVCWYVRAQEGGVMNVELFGWRADEMPSETSNHLSRAAADFRARMVGEADLEVSHSPLCCGACVDGAHAGVRFAGCGGSIHVGRAMRLSETEAHPPGMLPGTWECDEW